MLAEGEHNPTIFVGVKCTDVNCAFQIEAVREESNAFKYLDNLRDNLLYVGKNSNSSLSFYNYNEGKINILIKKFSGRGAFHFFYYDYGSSNNNWKSEKISIANATIVGEEQNFNIHLNNTNLKNKRIFSEVTTFTDDFVFSIKMYPDLKWNLINMGKNDEFLVGHSFYGYFAMLPTYESVNLNIRSRETYNTSISLYGKYKVLNKELDEGNTKNTDFDDFPNENNKDLNATFDTLLNQVKLIYYIHLG